jgi:predicted transglutaminase-like cysteine proteinase
VACVPQNKRSVRTLRTAIGSVIFPLLALGAGASPARAIDGVDTPPSASRWDLPPTDVSRRAVLLGGQSAMATLLVQQGTAVVANLPFAAKTGVAPQTVSPGPQTAAADMAPVLRRRATAAAPDSPNVFGSVALSVGGTPLDAMWRRASAESASVARWAGPLREAGGDRESMIREVNQWVNQRIDFADDARSNGRADHWQTAAESLGSGRGDCEDYALAKLQLLASLGVSRDDMYLVLVRDLVRRQDHAVLAVRLDGRFVVLDNNTDALLDDHQVQDYRPVMSYSGGRRWIHGYAADPVQPPLQIASAVVAVAGP